jgi:hypothetical protein
MSSNNPNVQLVYLELMDFKRALKVFCNGKILEDVGGQDSYGDEY